jgi:hypothetical protein
MKTDQDRQQFAREAAERAQAKLDEAAAGLARLAERRLRREDVLIRREIRKSADELAQFERDQRGDERLDAGDEAAFMREQLVPMLKDGWTLEELEGVGVTRETLSALGILHHLKQ